VNVLIPFTCIVSFLGCKLLSQTQHAHIVAKVIIPEWWRWRLKRDDQNGKRRWRLQHNVNISNVSIEPKKDASREDMFSTMVDKVAAKYDHTCFMATLQFMI
jgi:hypothetical protein